MNEENTVTDTRSDEDKAPLKQGAAPKANSPKAPVPPKEPWTAPAAALEAVGIIKGYADIGDKKVLAYFVGEAIEARARGKVVRDSLVNEDDEVVATSTDG